MTDLLLDVFDGQLPFLLPSARHVCAQAAIKIICMKEASEAGLGLALLRT